MTPHLTRKVPHAGNRWLVPLLPSILAAVSPIIPVYPPSLSAATEYLLTEDIGTIYGMTTCKGFSSSIPPLTISMEWNIYENHLPSSTLQIAPHMTGSRITCAIGKTQSKPYRPSKNVSALPYNGKRKVLPIRTTPPEIGVPAREKITAIIGPVQEILRPALSYERRVSQAVAELSSAAESPSLLGGQPIVALDRFRSTLQEPDNESHRMNLTTAQALHGGNCPGGCP